MVYPRGGGVKAARELCAQCRKRPATHQWGDMLAVTHGWTESRCGVCVYGPQLRHACSRAIRIPLLAAKLVFAWIRASLSTSEAAA